MDFNSNSYKEYKATKWQKFNNGTIQVEALEYQFLYEHYLNTWNLDHATKDKKKAFEKFMNGYLLLCEFFEGDIY